MTKRRHPLFRRCTCELIMAIYLDLRKDTNNCPFARFLPLGRILCEGAGNGHVLTTVVNFGFRAFWADLTLLCVKMRPFFWAEIPGKKAEIPGKRAEIPGQIHHDSKMKTWRGKFFLEMVIFILKWANLQKMDRNQTKICLGKKFVTNEYHWISRYVVQNRDESFFATWNYDICRKYRDKTWWTVISSGLAPHLISAPVTFRSCSPHFTVKLWLPQMLPNFGYGRQIMHTDVSLPS